MRALWPLAREAGFQLKLNTVVTRLNLCVSFLAVGERVHADREGLQGLRCNQQARGLLPYGPRLLCWALGRRLLPGSVCSNRRRLHAC